MTEKSEHDAALPSFDQITSIFVYFLRLHGLLPLKGRRFDYLPSRVLLYFFFGSSLINWSMMICFCLRMHSLTVDAICETVLVVGLNVRFYLMIQRRFEFAELLDECRSIWEQCNDHGRLSVIVFANKMRRLFLFLVCSGVSLVSMYTVNAFNTRLPPLEPNGTERRILPYKWYVDNPEDYWPGYTVTFLVQSLVVCNAGSYSTIVDTAVPLLIMICCGFLRSLSDRLYELSEDDYLGDQLLLDYSKFHQRVLNLCLRLEKLAGSIFLTQILCTAYNVSLLGIKISGTDPDRYKYVPMLVTMLGQLFVCHWAPDYLIDESLQVSTAAYFASFGWMRRRIGKVLLIVIARAQKPVKISAGGLGYLSLENYGHMITSAFSFFTMLRNFNL